MRTLCLIAALLAASCATTSAGYAESNQCPVGMTDAEHDSGVVRCRAICSSYARDFASYDSDCKCRCAPAVGGGYRPQVQHKQPRVNHNNQM